MIRVKVVVHKCIHDKSHVVVVLVAEMVGGGEMKEWPRNFTNACDFSSCRSVGKTQEVKERSKMTKKVMRR